MRHVAIVIPIYNARADVERLLTSLAEIYPNGGPSFVLADDKSSDPEMANLYDSHPFARRPDVKVLRAEQNRGFVQNVNHALQHVDDQADVLLLNSDTVFFSDPLPALQKAAYSLPNVASVTPLTTNGTIASVIDWPNGGQFANEREARVFDEAVRALGLEGAAVEVPTGIGFGMYMRRDALRTLGAFDAVYGRGYGEECDWCQRGINQGWKHLLMPAAFILHTGTKSFHSTEKQASIDKNTAVLLSRYPTYNQQVAKHFAQDPLGPARLALGVEWARRLTGKDLALFVLHGDPFGAAAGGTEAHVRHVIEKATKQGLASVVAYPTEMDGATGFYAFQVRHDGRALFKARVHATYLSPVCDLLAGRVGSAHFHHLRGWTDEGAALFLSLPCPKVATLHDAYLLCPKLFIHHVPAGAGTTPCTTLAPSDPCARCDADFQGKGPSLRLTKRHLAERLFAAVDQLVFPSAYLRDAFAPALKGAEAKAVVVPHDLDQIFGARSPDIEQTMRRGPSTKRILILGDVGVHKSKAQVEGIVPELEKRGHEVRFFGRMARGAESDFWKKRTVSAYDGPKALAKMLETYDPDVIVTPSAVGETYGFTFYEALLLSPSRTSVVVGPYGNPAEVSRKEGVAQVVADLTPQAMLDAIDSALAGNDSPRQAARRAFVDVLAKARGTNRTPDCFARHAATSDARKPDGRRLVEAAYGSSAMAFFDHFFLESQSKLGRQMQKVRRFIKTFRDWRDRSAGRSAP